MTVDPKTLILKDALSVEEQWATFGELTVSAQKDLLEYSDELEEELADERRMREQAEERIESLLEALEKLDALVAALRAHLE